MNRADFIQKYRHRLGGMVADAATSRRTGAELSVALRDLFDKIDALLEEAYADASPVPVLTAPPASQAAPGPIQNHKPAPGPKPVVPVQPGAQRTAK